MFKIEDYLQVISWLLYGAVSLLAIIGGLTVFIFRRHERENDLCSSNNREDHTRIWDAINSKQDKKR